MADRLASQLSALAATGVDSSDLLLIHDASGKQLSSITVAEFSKFTGAYNVLNYGATGDGTTDDSTAINAALAAAEDDGAGEVYMPYTADGYYCASSISVPTFVALRLDPWTTVKTDQNSPPRRS